MGKDIGFVPINVKNRTPNPGGNVPLLAPGEYRFRVMSVEGDQTNDGNPKMVLRVKAMDAITDDPKCRESVGNTIPHHQSLNQDSDFVMDRLANLVKATGIKATSKGFKPKDMVGAEFIAEVTHRQEERAGRGPEDPPRTVTFQQLSRERPLGEEDEEEEPTTAKRKKRKRKEEEEEEYEEASADEEEEEEEEEEERPRRRRRRAKSNSNAAAEV